MSSSYHYTTLLEKKNLKLQAIQDSRRRRGEEERRRRGGEEASGKSKLPIEFINNSHETRDANSELGITPIPIFHIMTNCY
jgi:hypothetical protein